MSAIRGSTVDFYPKDLAAKRLGIVTAINADGSVNLTTMSASGSVGSATNVPWFDTVQPAPVDKNDTLACPLA